MKNKRLTLVSLVLAAVICTVILICCENPTQVNGLNDSVENVLPYPYGDILKDVFPKYGIEGKQIKTKELEQNKIYVDGKAWSVVTHEDKVTLKKLGLLENYITIKRCDDTFVVNNHYVYSSDGKFIKDLILEKELGLDILPQHPYRNILKDLFLNYLGYDIKEFNVSKDHSIKLKLYKIRTNSNYTTKFHINKNGENGIVVKFDSKLDKLEKITINKADSLYIVTLLYHNFDRNWNDIYTKKEFVYDVGCNMVSLAQQIKNREDNMERQLSNVTSIKDEDKKILAAILSSKDILKMEFIESEDCLEAFGSNDEAAYRFVLCPTENNSGYWGFVNKMDKDAALQSDIRNSSSHIYAIKLLDKSTNDTKRMFVSIVQVIQEDLVSNNYKSKYDGKSTKTSTKGENKNGIHGRVINLGIVAGINGESLNSYDETSFTKEYMNEVRENLVYTYADGVLKLNEKIPYDMTKYRL